MADNTYSISEIVGSSKTSIDDAISGAVEPRLTDVAQPRLVRGDRHPGSHRKQRLCHFQVTIKVGFRLDEPT